MAGQDAPKGRRRTIWNIAIALVVLAIVIVIFMALLGGGGQEETSALGAL